MSSRLQWFEPGQHGHLWSFSRQFARPRHHHPETEFNPINCGRATFREAALEFTVGATGRGEAHSRKQLC